MFRLGVWLCPAAVVWVVCDADTMLTYVRRRGAARDAHRLARWAKYIGGMDLDFRLGADHHVIDDSLSAEPLKAQVEQLLAALAEREAS